MKWFNLIAVLVGLFAFFALSQKASAMYDPTLGRWLQRDPGAGGVSSPVRIGQYHDGMNLFLYVSSSPTTRRDALGLQTMSPGDLGGLISGGLGGVTVQGITNDLGQQAEAEASAQAHRKVCTYTGESKIDEQSYSMTEGTRGSMFTVKRISWTCRCKQTCCNADVAEQWVDNDSRAEYATYDDMTKRETYLRDLKFQGDSMNIGASDVQNLSSGQLGSSPSPSPSPSAPVSKLGTDKEPGGGKNPTNAMAVQSSNMLEMSKDDWDKRFEQMKKAFAEKCKAACEAKKGKED